MKRSEKDALLKKLNDHKATIAKEHDAMRETLAEYEEIIDQVDRAEDALETAIDAISESL